MKNILEKIRKSIRKHNETCYYGEMQDTARMIRNYCLYSKESSIVQSVTEDRGDRWTKWEVKVYKLDFNGEIAYFKVQEEVGKTEIQSDGGTVVEEVVPTEVTMIKYVSID